MYQLVLVLAIRNDDVSRKSQLTHAQSCKGRSTSGLRGLSGVVGHHQPCMVFPCKTRRKRELVAWNRAGSMKRSDDSGLEQFPRELGEALSK